MHRTRNRQEMMFVQGVIIVIITLAVGMQLGLNHARGSGPGSLGQELWTIDKGNFYQNIPAIGDVNDDGQQEIICTGSQAISCISNSGTIKWSTYLMTGDRPSMPVLAQCGNVSILDIFIYGYNSLYCIKGNSGSIKWQKTIPGLVVNNHAAADVDGDGNTDIIVSTSDNRIHCFSGNNGSIVWSSPLTLKVGSPMILVTSEPKEMLVLAGSSNNTLTSFFAKNGSVAWNESLGPTPVVPLLACDAESDGNIDVIVKTNTLACVSALNGSVIWQASGISFASALASDMNDDGILEIVGIFNGYIYCISAATGRQIWKSPNQYSGAVLSQLTDIDGTCKCDICVYTSTVVYALSGKNGSKILTYNPIGDIPGWGTVYPDAIYSCAISDLNDDGLLEMTVACHVHVMQQSDYGIKCVQLRGFSYEQWAPWPSAGGSVYRTNAYPNPSNTPVTTVPSEPQNLTKIARNTQVVLNWDAPASNGGSPITNYRIFQGIKSGTETFLTTVGNVTVYTITGLTNGQAYYFKVAAVNGAGTGANSTEASAMPVGVPPAPQSLTAGSGNTQVILNWVVPASNGGSPITNYRIYQGTASGGEALVATIGNVTTYTITGLTNGQTYYFKVAAVNSDGMGANSTEVSAMPVTIPSPPQNVSAIAYNGQVVLGWTSPTYNRSSSITGYRIYQGMMPGGETTLATIGNVTTFTSTGLVNGKSYYFKVAAVNSAGTSANSTETSAMPVTVPSAPQLLIAKSWNTQIVLNWTAPMINGGLAITNYRIYQGMDTGAETLLTINGNVTTYTITNLTNGQIYYFKVAAVNDVGTGLNSTEASATPATLPSAPRSLTATSGNAHVILNWAVPIDNGGSAIQGYRVYRGTTSGTETLIASIGVMLTYTATGLTNNQVYYFKISAKNAAGNGMNSSETSAAPSTDFQSSDQIGDEWPMFHGALNHTGVATTTPVAGTRPLWTYPTDNCVYYSSPAVVGGRVYIGSYDGKVYCFNATTGVLLWIYNTGGGVYSSPAISGDRLYVGNQGCNIYCLNAIMGTLEWTYTMGSTVDSSPAVAGGLVYVSCTDNKVYCLNAITGTLIWSFTTGNMVESSPAVIDGRVYVGGEDHKVYCLDAFTGARVWSFMTGDCVYSSPAVAGGRVYVGSWDHKIYCLNSTTGALVWSFTTGNWVYSSPAVEGGCVFVGSEDKVMYCLDAINGMLKWTYTTSGALISSPALANGCVYVGSEDHKVYCLDAVTGALNWLYTTGNAVFSSPAIAGGRVYVGSEDHYVYCLPMLLNPSIPRNFQVTSGDGQVVLSWQAPSSNGGSTITNYRIYQGTTSGIERLVVTIGNINTYTITGLTNGQVYYFKVAAVNGVGTGANSSESSAMPVGVPSAPQSLSVVPGNKQVVLNWAATMSNGGSAITNYRIYQGTASGSETLLAIIGNVTTYTSTGLTNGQAYYFKVAAVNGVGTGANSTEISAAPATVPSAPQSFTATPGNAGVILNWVVPASTGGSAIQGYHVYRGTTSGGETLVATKGNMTTYTVTGLANGQAYYFKVAAMNGVGTGANSTEASAILVGVPSAPQSLTVMSRNTQVILNWATPASNGGSTITGYKVFKGIASEHETSCATLGVVLTYTAMNLTNGQVYYFMVCACNALGNGVNTTEANAMPVPVPSVPRSLTATSGNAQVVLNWVAPASNGGSPITNYWIYQGTASGGETLIGSIGNVTSCTVTGLTNGQVYYFHVAAYNGICIGEISAEINATPRTMPSVPQSFELYGGNIDIGLRWAAPAINGGSVITGYQVYRGTTPGSEILIASLGNIYTYISTGLTIGQIYYFQVSAKNIIGEGSRTAENSAIPATFPGAPQNFVVTPGNGRVALNWAPPADNGGSVITKYIICCTLTPRYNYNVTTVGPVLTYTYTGLINGKTYYFQISASNRVGDGPRTIELSATPDINGGRTVPTSPRCFCAKSGDGQVQLSWNVSVNDGGSPITSYRIFRGTASNGELLLVTIGNVTTFTSNGLTNGQVYYFKVAAINAMGTGANSTEASATPVGPPAAPQSFTATPGNAQVVLNWAAPASNGGSAIIGYNIYQGTRPGGETLSAILGDVSNYTATGLTNGREYYFKVAAWNTMGIGMYSREICSVPIMESNTTNTPTLTTPGMPLSLRATATNKQVVLSWQCPTSNGGCPIINYTIYRATISGNETRLVNTGNVTSYMDTSVSNDRVYYYAVSAINNKGEGMFSVEIMATPKDVDSNAVPLPGNPTPPSSSLVSCLLLAIGSMMSLSTLVVARRIKIRHYQATKNGLVPTSPPPQGPSDRSGLIGSSPEIGQRNDARASTTVMPGVLSMLDPASPVRDIVSSIEKIRRLMQFDIAAYTEQPSIDDILGFVPNIASIFEEAGQYIDVDNARVITEMEDLCKPMNKIMHESSDVSIIDVSRVGVPSRNNVLRVGNAELHHDPGKGDIDANSDAHDVNGLLTLICPDCTGSIEITEWSDCTRHVCKTCKKPMQILLDCKACFTAWSIQAEDGIQTNISSVKCPVCHEKIWH